MPTPPDGAVGSTPPEIGGVRTAAELRKSAFTPELWAFAPAQRSITARPTIATVLMKNFK
jgi:hypothetical protein